MTDDGFNNKKGNPYLLTNLEFGRTVALHPDKWSKRSGDRFWMWAWYTREQRLYAAEMVLVRRRNRHGMLEDKVILHNTFPELEFQAYRNHKLLFGDGE
jgi:hypothetical protein